MGKTIDNTPVGPSWVEKLAQFFDILVINNDDLHFLPHPLTNEMARKIGIYEGDDLYFLQIMDNEIAGYAMLRGWDEGYAIPSLGIAIHPAFRNQGLGREFMRFLHNQVRIKGENKVRLKVYANNAGAKRLYESLGYSFITEENGQFIGCCDL